MYRHTQKHTMPIQYTSSHLKCCFPEGYDFIHYQDDFLFCPYLKNQSASTFPVFLHLSSGFPVWQFAVNFKDGEQNLKYDCDFYIHICEIFKKVLAYKFSGAKGL